LRPEHGLDIVDKKFINGFGVHELDDFRGWPCTGRVLREKTHLGIRVVFFPDETLAKLVELRGAAVDLAEDPSPSLGLNPYRFPGTLPPVKVLVASRAITRSLPA